MVKPTQRQQQLRTPCQLSRLNRGRGRPTVGREEGGGGAERRGSDSAAAAMRRQGAGARPGSPPPVNESRWRRGDEAGAAALTLDERGQTDPAERGLQSTLR
ncbi:hypothetical protein EYF80_064941 [Liparis tanakae]|uniref:Uncharacterized protein n=1 Tax=Liparis tanakae TaxID=230148 RepID=A0A4Z2E9C9_9TELE|nr:hypothetical protein EYF80_064941 [Liparis tanakae]